MRVYIEIVIIDNFLITYLVGNLAYRSASEKVKQLRLVLASLLSAAAAVAYPFLHNFLIGFILIRIGLFAALILILFLRQKRFFFKSLVFLILTFAFGGLMFAIGLLVFGSVNHALTIPATFIPFAVVPFLGFVLYILIRRAIKKKKRLAITSQFEGSAEIKILGKTVSGSAFVDTGNLLYDPEDDLPIIVLGTKLSLEILGNEGLSAVMRDNIREISPEARYIYYNSAARNRNKILLLRPEKVHFFMGEVEHKIENVLTGLVFSRFSSSDKFDVILHPEVLKKVVV